MARHSNGDHRPVGHKQKSGVSATGMQRTFINNEAMKIFSMLLLALLVLAQTQSCAAFVENPGQAFSAFRSVSRTMSAVPLEPEPEGGEEFHAFKSMPGARLKNMGEAKEVKNNALGNVYEFWLTAKVQGALVKEIRTQILKDASKKANFPGFRKVSFFISIRSANVDCLFLIRDSERDKSRRTLSLR
jgi:hypothetical protein